jgi:hypothetical protein
MRLGQAAAAALALIAASPGSAQEAVRTDQPSVQMPKELGGGSGLSVGDGMTLYPSSRPGIGPMIGIMIVDSDKAVAMDEMAGSVRDRHRKNGLRRIMREGTFTTSKWPGAKTFFGEYETGKDFNQTWMMSTGRQNVLVTITYLKKKDAARAEAEVAEKIFGGAVISASKPAE